MKRFSSQYIFTNTGHPLKRAVITTEDDGTIIDIEDTGGYLQEHQSTEFYNGIIIPGFVNCHCHLELSHMKNSIAEGKGLASFLENISTSRGAHVDTITDSASEADRNMFQEGIVLCADICNTSSTFSIKLNSKITYINFLEVFGMDPDIAVRRIEEIREVSLSAEALHQPYQFVPHTAYSTSLTLFRLLRKISETNKISSIHFMETEGERAFIEDHTGPLYDYFRESGFIPSRLETVKDHSDAVLNEITPSGNLILVHNTFVDRSTIRSVMKRKNLFWCLCPRSNLYIENLMPPVDLLMAEDCELVIGTDSLASNHSLSILGELKQVQQHFPLLSIEDLVLMATANGAKALGMADQFGKIEKGMKPGLLLLENIDLINMKLLPDSTVRRLI